MTALNCSAHFTPAENALPADTRTFNQKNAAKCVTLQNLFRILVHSVDLQHI